MDIYAKKLYYYCLNILGNSADAEEVVQDTFIKVYHKIDSFSNKYKFSVWLYKIALNAAKDKIRQRNSRGAKFKISYSNANHDSFESGNTDRNIPDNRSNPSDTIHKTELNNIIIDEINKLSYKHKEVLLLLHIENHSYSEIADILDCSEGTVKSRISRARKILKQQLKEKIYKTGNF